MQDTVIIGAGQAGFSIAAGLRKRNADMHITLIGTESHLPYQRPPLSKKYLLGEVPQDRLLLRPEAWYANNRIQVITNRSVVKIDRTAQKVLSDNGQEFPYDHLALTLGAQPRMLPDSVTLGGRNVFGVRNINDIANIQPLMQAGKNLLIIGGGYIGLEAASVARKIGLNVTLLEAAPRILGRVAAPATADFFRNLHQENGVHILEQTTLEHFDCVDDVLVAAALANGQKIPTDIVIVGIGVLPISDIANQAELAVDQGILVNEYGQTSDPNIFAAGDCVRFAYRNQKIRLESVQNATDQGDCVAANILGADTPYCPKPWFWSDQYDVKLQIAGLCQGYTRTITRAGKRDGAQSVWYFQDDQLLAVDAMNDTLAYGIGKKLIDAGISPAMSAIENTSTNLKELL